MNSSGEFEPASLAWSAMPAESGGSILPKFVRRSPPTSASLGAGPSPGGASPGAGLSVAPGTAGVQPGQRPARGAGGQAKEAAAPTSSRRRGRLRATVATMRPRQWIKNILVIAAPGAAGALGHDDVPVRVALACAAFCLLASGIYAMNDARDAAEDRQLGR